MPFRHCRGDCFQIVRELDLRDPVSLGERALDAQPSPEVDLDPAMLLIELVNCQKCVKSWLMSSKYMGTRISMPCDGCGCPAKPIHWLAPRPEAL